MLFPEKPTCHVVDPVFKIGSDVSWREPRDGETYRTCSYCGSIHPEDLIKVLSDVGRLGGSDWKYSWPHKFYVYLPDGKMAKWYNEHIMDDGFDDEARSTLLSILENSGITFKIHDGKLGYSAPYHGYQK